MKENETLKKTNIEIDKAITLEYKYNNVVENNNNAVDQNEALKNKIEELEDELDRLNDEAEWSEATLRGSNDKRDQLQEAVESMEAKVQKYKDRYWDFYYSVSKKVQDDERKRIDNRKDE